MRFRPSTALFGPRRTASRSTGRRWSFSRTAAMLDDALGLLDRAANSLPQEPWIPVLRAALLESNGRTEQAQQLLQDTQRRWPEMPAVWVAEGLILAAHGNPEQARRALETAVSLGARSPEVAACLTALKQGSTSRSGASLFHPAAAGVVIRPGRVIAGRRHSRTQAFVSQTAAHTPPARCARLWPLPSDRTPPPARGRPALHKSRASRHSMNGSAAAARLRACRAAA